MCRIVILFQFEKTQILFGSIWKKTQFGSDIVVTHYLCNTWVVNLQQILQNYCDVLNELCTQDFDPVVNKLWRHSQQ